MSIIKPNLLIPECERQKITVFCCGPGVNHQLYSFREKIKHRFEEKHLATITFGEDLPLRQSYSGSGRDLQTAESHHAQLVDFTILILASPGSIAELGTFTMMPSVRPRLYVAVDSKFFEDTSYIARGPLSILSKHSPTNVIYYSLSDREDRAISSFDLPACFYKFARYTVPLFNEKTKNIFGRKRRIPKNHYPSFIRPIREKFFFQDCVSGDKYFASAYFF